MRMQAPPCGPALPTGFFRSRWALVTSCFVRSFRLPWSQGPGQKLPGLFALGAWGRGGRTIFWLNCRGGESGWALTQPASRQLTSPGD